MMKILTFTTIFYFSLFLFTHSQEKDTEVFKPEVSLKISEKSINSMALSENEEYFVTLDQDKILRFWNFKEQKEIKQIPIKYSSAKKLLLSPNNSKVIVIAENNDLIVWDIEKNLVSKRIEKIAYDATFEDENNILVANNNKLYKHNLNSFIETTLLNYDIDVFHTHCLILPKKRLLVAVSATGDCYIYNIDKNTIMAYNKINITHPSKIIMDKEENKIICFSHTTNVVNFCAINYEKNKIFSHNYTITLKSQIQLQNVKMSGDGRHLLFVNNENLLCVFSFETKNMIKIYRTQNTINDFSLGNDDLRAIVMHENGFLEIGEIIESKKKDLEKRINKKLSKWFLKQDFEKSEVYHDRVSEKNIIVEVNQIMNNLKNYYEIEKIISCKNATLQYNADHEVFYIKFKDFYMIQVPVNLNEAPLFKQNFANLVCENPVFTFTKENELYLHSLNFVDRTNNKKYQYINQNEVILKSFALNSENTKKIAKQVQKNESEQKEQIIEKQPLITKEEVKKEDKKDIEKEPKTEILTSDVDINIPKSKTKNPDAIAVIIGNKNYDKVKEVKFAIHDAQIIKKYLITTLGFKEENILYFENAKLSDFKVVFGDNTTPKGRLYNMVKPEKSDVFIFYSGHGAPSLENKKGYFVPADCDPQYLDLLGYSLDVFFDNLGKIRAKNINIVLDACFSGTDIYENISPIVIKSKNVENIKGVTLLTSSKLEEVSCWYNEKNHGLFTYFFLKALQDKNADLNKDNKITFQEIHKFVSDNTEAVPYFARRLHGIEQTPTLKGSNLDKIFVVFE